MLRIRRLRYPLVPYLVVSLLVSPNGDSLGDTGSVGDPKLAGPLLFREYSSFFPPTCCSPVD